MPGEPSRAIFLSYASQDAEAARRVAGSLRAAGIEVWFDQNELVGGDAWDAKIRKQISACALFVPLISATTQARGEGYFRIEWRLAAQRTHAMADDATFLLPVVIDDTRDADARVPAEFKAVQWTRLPGGEPNAAFCARVKTLLGGESAAAPTAQPGAEAPKNSPSSPRRTPWLVAIMLMAASGVGVALWRPWRATEKSAVAAASTTASVRPLNGGQQDVAASGPEARKENRRASATAPAASEKSLVVLPLENLSPDPDNAFFTDGMHAEIISTLGRIPELRVISRNSTLAFKGGAYAIAEVAQKLGVANVITGSVRREKNRVKIQLELRRASDETLLWSQTYERELSDQFAIQSEIANDVARALQIRNATGTMQWARLFTNNPDAYDLFLKTLELYNTPFGSGAKGLAKAEECVRRFEEVLRLDPQFSVATSYLSRAHNNAAGRSTDPVARARHAAEARRLAEEFSKALPGGAGDGALANYYSNIENNYERSLSYAQNVVRALPNDAAGYSYLGIASMGLGRYREAVTAMRRALEIDPLTTTYWENLIFALACLREEAEMEKAIARYTALTGTKAGTDRIMHARFAVRAEVPRDVSALDGRAQRLLLWTARRYSEALHECEQELAGNISDNYQRANLLAWKCLLLEALAENKDELARTRAALTALVEQYAQISPEQTVGVRDTLGSGVRQNMGVGLPDNFRRLSAWVFNCLGRGDEAVNAAKAEVEARNPNSEARQRWISETSAAAIYARFGHKKEAIELVRHLLSVPSQVTVPLLRASPDWDSLRDEPEFKALLADPKNSAPL